MTATHDLYFDLPALPNPPDGCESISVYVERIRCNGGEEAVPEPDAWDRSHGIDLRQKTLTRIESEMMDSVRVTCGAIRDGDEETYAEFTCKWEPGDDEFTAWKKL